MPIAVQMNAVGAVSPAKVRLLEERNLFFIQSHLWALCLEEFIGIQNSVAFKHEIYGHTQSATYSILGLQGQVFLCVLRFNFNKEHEPIDGDRFTCHSKLWPVPYTKSVGVPAEEASWEFMFERVFRPLVEAWALEQLQTAKAVLRRSMLPDNVHEG